MFQYVIRRVLLFIPTLFLITVGLIIWAFRPASPEKMFERGADLMRSKDPADWELAWSDQIVRHTGKPSLNLAPLAVAARSRTEKTGTSRTSLARARMGPLRATGFRGLRDRPVSDFRAACLPEEFVPASAAETATLADD